MKTSADMQKDSYDRAYSQPLYVDRIDDEHYEVYNALTNNTYTVTVDPYNREILECTCPHFVFRCGWNNIYCKHEVRVANELGYEI